MGNRMDSNLNKDSCTSGTPPDLITRIEESCGVVKDDKDKVQSLERNRASGFDQSTDEEIRPRQPVLGKWKHKYYSERFQQSFAENLAKTQLDVHITVKKQFQHKYLTPCADSEGSANEFFEISCSPYEENHSNGRDTCRSLIDTEFEECEICSGEVDFTFYEEHLKLGLEQNFEDIFSDKDAKDPTQIRQRNSRREIRESNMKLKLSGELNVERIVDDFGSRELEESLQQENDEGSDDCNIIMYNNPLKVDPCYDSGLQYPTVFTASTKTTSIDTICPNSNINLSLYDYNNHLGALDGMCECVVQNDAIPPYTVFTECPVCGNKIVTAEFDSHLQECIVTVFEDSFDLGEDSSQHNQKQPSLYECPLCSKPYSEVEMSYHLGNCLQSVENERSDFDKDTSQYNFGKCSYSDCPSCSEPHREFDSKDTIQQYKEQPSIYECPFCLGSYSEVKMSAHLGHCVQSVENEMYAFCKDTTQHNKKQPPSNYECIFCLKPYPEVEMSSHLSKCAQSLENDIETQREKKMVLYELLDESAFPF